MIHGSMIWNFVNSMPQVYIGSPLVWPCPKAVTICDKQCNTEHPTKPLQKCLTPC